MPDEITPADEAVLQRRRFLRGSALLAAAAGGAVVATTTSAVPASAADNDAVLVGGSFDGTTTTTLALEPGSKTSAALTLANPTGPALQLTPVTDFTGNLPAGGLAVQSSGGLLLGLQDGADTITADVLTTYDLRSLPITVPFPAGRVLNTKDDATLDTVVATSSGAFDSKGRLRKGAWVDVALLPTDGFPYQVVAAHLTLTALGSSSSGSLVTCPPGEKPAKVATLPFDKGRTVATGTYVETGEVANNAAVRIYASATTHLKLDVTGFTILISFGAFSDPTTNVAKVARSAQEKVAKHVQQVSARARLV
ncbi:MAG: hypothetical protein ACRYG2_36065 [Janthinobacterium lividum]